MLVKALNKLLVVTRRVITNKVVEFIRDFKVIKYVKYNRRLGSPSIVSKKVAKGN